MIGARQGSPLGRSAMATAKCTWGRMPWPWRRLTNRISYLEEGDWVELTREGAQVIA